MKKQQTERRHKNYTLLIIILALVFGLIGGGVGQIMSGSLLFPFDSNIIYSGYNQGNLIIRDSRKVVVNYDIKINEAINAINNSFVGLFEKRNLVSVNDSVIDILENDRYYNLSEELAHGVIITNDGWVMIGDGAIVNEDNMSNYVIILKDKTIYEIDDVVNGSQNPFSFIHLEKASDLNVQKFIKQEDLSSGKTIIVMDWDNNILTSSISMEDYHSRFIGFSDEIDNQLILSNNVSEIFSKNFVFDIDGDVVAFINKSNEVIPISVFSSSIQSILLNQVIELPQLGIYYVNLSRLATEDNLSGALVYREGKEAIVKDSLAELTGLEEGDIIVSINNIKIDEDNDLNDLVYKYLADDGATMIYVREGKEFEIDIKLSE